MSRPPVWWLSVVKGKGVVDGGRRIIRHPTPCLSVEFRLHHQWRPKIMPGSIIQAFEGRRSDADDRKGMAVHENRFADDHRIGVEATPPERMAQHNNWKSVFRAIFFRQKASPQDGLDA